VISWSLVVSQPCHCYAASLLKTNLHGGHLQGLLLGLFLGLALGQGHALYQGINTCLLNCCVSILTFLLTCILFLVYVRERGRVIHMKMRVILPFFEGFWYEMKLCHVCVKLLYDVPSVCKYCTYSVGLVTWPCHSFCFAF
jgi:hypothetical protein